MQKFTGMVNVWTGERYYINNRKKRVERMKARVIAWAKMQPAGGWHCMITLTYDTLKTKHRRGKYWEKRDITDFIRRLRVILKSKGVQLWGYAWTGEMQPSGNPHYHVLLHLDKKLFRFHVDKLGLWYWGDTEFTPARTVGYIVKYASKGEDELGEFPKGMRIFAIWPADENIARAIKMIFEPVWKKRARMAGFNDDEIKEFGAPDMGWRYVGNAEAVGYLDVLIDTYMTVNGRIELGVDIEAGI